MRRFLINKDTKTNYHLLSQEIHQLIVTRYKKSINWVIWRHTLINSTALSWCQSSKLPVANQNTVIFLSDVEIGWEEGCPTYKNLFRETQ